MLNKLGDKAHGIIKQPMINDARMKDVIWRDEKPTNGMVQWLMMMMESAFKERDQTVDDSEWR